MPFGSVPNSSCDPRVPSPFPSNTLILFAVTCGIATSGFPSLLKSPAAIATGVPLTAPGLGAIVDANTKDDEYSAWLPITAFEFVESRKETVPVGNGFQNAATVAVRV